MNRKRAWVYCRVAHPDPDALESQRLHLLDYADRQGLSIVGVTAENGSGWITHAQDYVMCWWRQKMA